eukprot:TRINITY_DN25676_c0_g1_i2.p1 TRINITY_DN25676_c0_g1~~TRINITY_DN25676_c0_g1_i2.p1  ORF type:complete len:122 (-),score=36.43 TRINITY_DN25676_c0_g1_i2:117-482(-)
MRLLLLSVSVLGVLVSASLQEEGTPSQREKEEEEKALLGGKGRLSCSFTTDSAPDLNIRWELNGRTLSPRRETTEKQEKEERNHEEESISIHGKGPSNKNREITVSKSADGTLQSELTLYD